MALMATNSSDSTDRDFKKYMARVRPGDWVNPQPRDLYDLLVLGGGPAGLAAAESAAAAGLTVALVERDRLGGNSLNVGSIPSKAIIRSGRVALMDRDSRVSSAPRAGAESADFDHAISRMREIRMRVAEYHSIDRLTAEHIDVYFSEARFLDRRSVIAGNARLRFTKAIIATGSRPRPSDIPGLDTTGFLTSSTIFDMATLPPRLAIIGGGPLGCELAQAFCRLGSHVTILQNQAKFLPREERDAAELLSLSLSRDGVDTRLNTAVIGAAIQGAEKVLQTVNDGVHSTIAADEILLSTGRVPNVESLCLPAAGIVFETEGGIKVNDFLRTTNARVYAAGDVCSSHKFTNVAQATGRMAVLNAFGKRRERQSHLLIPWCTFCDPEIAHIGMQVWEARQQGVPVKTFTIMMQDVDRAMTDGQDDGFVKLHIRDGTDEILGATIMASRASEMINEVSVLMSARIGMRKLARILHTYPAQSDAIRLAAAAFLRDEKSRTS
jgi:pyruvate/2-oxoglutarate dehydrogenase complex dihydrolipoamide dehydrogenase (E3) component